MGRVLKYRPSDEPWGSELEAVKWIYDGNLVYLHHKIYHAKWSIHWSVAQITNGVRSNTLIKAVPNVPAQGEALRPASEYGLAQAIFAQENETGE